MDLRRWAGGYAVSARNLKDRQHKVSLHVGKVRIEVISACRWTIIIAALGMMTFAGALIFVGISC